MIVSTLHRIVANPRIYDLVQFLAGKNIVEKHMRARLETLSEAEEIIDIGGGTGALQKMFSDNSLYVCLDIDTVKIDGYRNKVAEGVAVLADATLAPIRSGSIDLVVCKFLSHHIPPERIEFLFSECYRILKPSGTLLFVDAVRNDRRFRSRFLWKYDRGSFPRTYEQMRELIGRHGSITFYEEFSYLHEYILCLSRKNEI